MSKQKTVDFYLVSSCLSMAQTKKGACLVEMSFEGRTKIVSIAKEYTTSCRIILEGLIEATTKLKEPCFINVHMPNIPPFNSPNSPNYDLVASFKEIVSARGHMYRIEVSSNHVHRLKSKCRALLK